MAGRKAERTVSAKQANAKPDPAQLVGQRRSPEESQAVDLVVPPIPLADASEAGDSAGQLVLTAVLIDGHEDGPIAFLSKVALAARTRNSTRFSDIEQEKASRMESVVDPAKQGLRAAVRSHRVKQVIDTFANGCNADTGIQVSRPERLLPEASERHAAPGQREHCRGNIETKDIVAGRHDLCRQDAAAAPKIDHQAIVESVSS
jgi:hypothetical protein